MIKNKGCYISVLFPDFLHSFVGPTYNQCQNLFHITATPGIPNQPEVEEVTATTITISWSPPSYDGGSKITGYTIESKSDATMRWVKIETTVPDTTYTAARLKELSEYQFRVAAINKAGRGDFSKPSRPVTCKPPYGEHISF